MTKMVNESSVANSRVMERGIDELGDLLLRMHRMNYHFLYPKQNTYAEYHADLGTLRSRDLKRINKAIKLICLIDDAHKE